MPWPELNKQGKKERMSVYISVRTNTNAYSYMHVMCIYSLTWCDARSLEEAFELEIFWGPFWAQLSYGLWLGETIQRTRDKGTASKTFHNTAQGGTELHLPEQTSNRESSRKTDHALEHKVGLQEFSGCHQAPWTWIWALPQKHKLKNKETPYTKI